MEKVLPGDLETFCRSVNQKDPRLCGMVDRIFGFLSDRDRARFSMASHACYEVATGEPFVPIVGEQDRYALIRELRREDAEEIMARTGMRIAFPSGRQHYGVVTSWNDRSSEKLCLGKGSFGVFCIVYALKSRNYLGVKITEGSEEVDAELAVHRALKGSAHLVEAIDFCRVTRSDGRVTLFQMMELAGLGSVQRLRQPIRELNDPQLKEQLLFHVAQGFLLGVDAMHRAGFFHLDPKLENLLVRGDGEVLVADFGTSKQVDGGSVNALCSGGDYNYSSPERWIASNVDTPESALCQGGPLDAWSAGIALLELICVDKHVLPMADVEEILGRPFEALSPHLQQELKDFEGRPRNELFEALVDRRVGVEDSLLWEYLSMVRGLLAFDPERRSTVRQALAHPWFARMEEQVGSARQDIRDRLRELVQGLLLVQEAGPSRAAVLPRANLLSPQERPLPHFTNYIRRTELEDAVRRSLFSNVRLTVLQGPPGVGKSEVAAFLSHDPAIRGRYEFILWFRGADDAAQIELQYLTLAQELGLADATAKFPDVFPVLMHYLATRDKPWLLVFDNAGDSVMLPRYIPPAGGQVLVTSRSTAWEDSVLVGPLSDADGRLLVHRLLRKQEPDADRLCETLAYLPLGIVQACAFIRNQRLTIAEYLRQFDRSPALLALEERQDGHRDLPYSIERLYELTFNELRKVKALQLLHRLACLGPDQIPQDWISALIEGPDIDPDAQQALLDYAILRPSSTGVYAIHRLPRRLIRDRLTSSELAEALPGVLGLLSDRHEVEPVTSEEVERSRGFLLHSDAALALRRRFPRLSVSDTKALALTLREVIGGHDAIGETASMVPLIVELESLASQAWRFDDREYALCLRVLGIAQLNLGKSDLAVRLHEQSAEIYQRAGGNRDPDYATSLEALAQARLVVGDHERALADFQSALEIFSERSPPIPLLIAQTCHNIGAAHYVRGEYRLARGAVELVLQGMAATDNADGLAVVKPWDLLGCILRELGEEKRSIESHLRALAIGEKLLGFDNPEVAAILGNLGAAYDASGDSGQAIDCYKRGLRILEREFGSDSPRLAASLANLGIAYIHMGKHERAIAKLEQALKLRTAQFGEQHEEVAAVLINLACAHEAAKDPDEPIRLCLKALEIRKQVWGERHLLVAKSHCLVARAWSKLDVGELAAKSYKEGLSIYEATGDENDPNLVQCLEGLGEALVASGEYGEAEQAYQRCLGIRRRTLGEDHPDVAGTLNGLGVSWASQKKHDKALPYFEQAYDIACRHSAMGEEHPDTVRYQKNFKSAKKIVKAEQNVAEYRQVVEARKRELGELHPFVANALYLLGESYLKLDQLGPAFESFREAHEIALRNPRLGEGHPDTEKFGRAVETAHGLLMVKGSAQLQLLDEVARDWREMGMGEPPLTIESLIGAAATERSPLTGSTGRSSDGCCQGGCIVV